MRISEEHFRAGLAKALCGQASPAGARLGRTRSPAGVGNDFGPDCVGRGLSGRESARQDVARHYVSGTVTGQFLGPATARLAKASSGLALQNVISTGRRTILGPYLSSSGDVWLGNAWQGTSLRILHGTKNNFWVGRGVVGHGWSSPGISRPGKARLVQARNGKAPLGAASHCITFPARHAGQISGRAKLVKSSRDMARLGSASRLANETAINFSAPCLSQAGA